ncbi:olfactory receptor 10A7-like [Malaclemys terrapin pileata]|uniref:olfactory receptor 10A7-like n=1 Tax=Malaclemys terrapin pileata TaxID=2991368 RepID=UPI0023A900A0|nr:olfactory receptor 10A7-like [Malaclemys terrapin pileata]
MTPTEEAQWRNQTLITEFILLGFPNLLHLQGLLFCMVLFMYMVTVMGNTLIILVITVDPTLHSPMYFFLGNLAFIEICFTLDTVPKMLVNLLAEDKSISFAGCAVQMYFFFFFGCAECFLLAAMAYDRYIAICHPLRYNILMNQRVCRKMVGGAWVIGVPVSLLQAAWIFNLPFCGTNKVNHFFCDAPPVLKLVCADTYLYEMQAVASTFLFLMFPFMLILVSYICILTTILRMPSAESRRKTFSTCSSHLIVVTLFYGSGSLVYLRPKSSYSPDIKKLLSLFYTILTPMLNPIIYSLRNSDVKGALRRMIGWKLFLQN